MATESVLANPPRWELAPENIAVKMQEVANNPWKSRGFCVSPWSSCTLLDRCAGVEPGAGYGVAILVAALPQAMPGSSLLPRHRRIRGGRLILPPGSASGRSFIAGSASNTTSCRSRCSSATWSSTASKRRSSGS